MYLPFHQKKPFKNKNVLVIFQTSKSTSIHCVNLDLHTENIYGRKDEQVH